MKQVQYTLFLLLLGLVGCGKDEIKSEQGELVPSFKEISFSVGSVSDSRATIMDNSNFVVDGRTIGVFAGKHIGNLGDGSYTANVMNNEELVYSNGIWSYSPLQYWNTNSDSLYSFVAYSPYSPFVSSGKQGLEYSYVNSTKSEDQIDLLYAVTKNINTPGTPVALDFKHALSKVVFKISGDFSSQKIDKVEITDVNLRGLYNSATFGVNSYSGACSWSDYSNAVDISVFNGSYNISAEKSVVGEPLMLIPQELNNVEVDLSYKIYQTGSSLYQLKHSTFVLPVNNVAEWMPNNSYVYNMKLTLKGVDFSVTVSDFDSTLTIPVDVPEGEDYGYTIPVGAIEYVVEVDSDGYVNAGELYNVAHLIEGSEPNAVIQMAYLDEEGCVSWQDWTVTDGWFGYEGALFWNDESSFACIQPNADGTFATITCKPETEVGTTATAILDYGNGVILAIKVIVADLPVAPLFVAPEADYVIDIDVAEDNSITAFSLDGELTSKGQYSNQSVYLNPIQDICIDLTQEIEIALGISEGTLINELLAGRVLMGAYDESNKFLVAHMENSSNTFFCYNKSGAALTSYGSIALIDGIGYKGLNNISLSGVCQIISAGVPIGDVYPSYIVFKNADSSAEYVIKVNQHVVDVPEIISYQVIEEYSIIYNVPYTGNYENLASDEHYLSSEMVAEIETMLGGEVDEIFMQEILESGDVKYVEGSNTDWWFGTNGTAAWGQGAKVCMKPLIPYEFSYVTTHPDANIGDVAKIVYQYCCSATRKAVNIEYIITIVESASE